MSKPFAVRDLLAAVAFAVQPLDDLNLANLLDDAEKACFARLAVFAGGAPLELPGYVPDAELGRVWKKLQTVKTRTCPFVTVPRTNEQPHWAKPVFVADVKFTEWTADRKLRHPTYLGLRDDVKPDSVRLEARGARLDSLDVRLGDQTFDELNLVEGGEVKEYSAHVIPEAGLAMMPQMTGDGMLVAGDAASAQLARRSGAMFGRKKQPQNKVCANGHVMAATC